MIVNKIEPQGYCGGVIHAIKMAMDAAKDSSIKKPIYMLGQIIHNANVIKDLEHEGIITIYEEGYSPPMVFPLRFMKKPKKKA